jgi:P27 family predicted phage terminase small subunit
MAIADCGGAGMPVAISTASPGKTPWDANARESRFFAMKKSTPKKLSAEARRWRKKIIESFELDDDAGMLLLQTAMEAFDEMRRAQNQIAQDGAVVKDRFGQLRQHPAALNLRDSRTAMMRSLKALNLDIEQPGPIGRPPGR